MKMKTTEQRNGGLPEKANWLVELVTLIVNRYSNKMEYKRANSKGNKQGKTCIQTSIHAHTCMPTHMLSSKQNIDYIRLQVTVSPKIGHIPLI